MMRAEWSSISCFCSVQIGPHTAWLLVENVHTVILFMLRLNIVCLVSHPAIDAFAKLCVRS